MAKLFGCYLASLPASYDPHCPRAPPSDCLPDSRPGGIGLWPALPLHCQLKFVRSLIQASCLARQWRTNQKLRSSLVRPMGGEDCEVGRWGCGGRRGWRATWCLGGSLLAPYCPKLTPTPIKMVRPTDSSAIHLESLLLRQKLIFLMEPQESFHPR